MLKDKKEVKKEKTKKAPKYKVVIVANEIVSKFEGNDLMKILQKYEAPTVFKTKFEVEVKSGSKVASSFVLARKAKRLFYNGTALKLFTVNLERRLG